MALFHFNVDQIKRSTGQSAIACAAYRSGEKLYSEYYGEYSDYTRKGGVVHTEILLPDHAPRSYIDRQTLWNAVEFAKRGKKAQLAYSFEIALQNEFSMEENIELARHFLLEHFVSRGMIVDFAVHQPDREDGGIQNPHIHFMCPIRPLEPDGSWGKKQRREYLLDENGERIKDDAGHDKFNAVPTTDWGQPETLEYWRQMWAETVNAKFEEKGLPHRIDHRSYERQGIDLIPTVHEGPAVRAMECKGIRTEKGEFNRWVRATNALILSVRDKIAKLKEWIAGIQAGMDVHQRRSLVDLLKDYYDQRNAGAYSNKAKARNVKEMSEMVIYLQENGIATLDDLLLRVQAYSDSYEASKTTLDAQTARMKEIRKLYDHADAVRRLTPIYEEYRSIRFDKPRAKFKADHKTELNQYFAARRILEKEFPDGNFNPDRLEQEYAELEALHDESYAQFRELRENSTMLWKLKRIVDSATKQEQPPEHSKEQNTER